MHVTWWMPSSFIRAEGYLRPGASLSVGRPLVRVPGIRPVRSGHALADMRFRHALRTRSFRHASPGHALFRTCPFPAMPFPDMSFSGARVTHLPPLRVRAYRRNCNVSATEVRQLRDDSSTGSRRPRGGVSPRWLRPLHGVVVTGCGRARKSIVAREPPRGPDLAARALRRLLVAPGREPDANRGVVRVVRGLLAGERWLFDGTSPGRSGAGSTRLT